MNYTSWIRNPQMIEWRGEHPFSVVAEHLSSSYGRDRWYESTYDVEEIDGQLYYNDSGSGLGRPPTVTLTGLCRRWRRGYAHERIWIADGVRVRCTRIASRWWAYRWAYRLTSRFPYDHPARRWWAKHVARFAVRRAYWWDFWRLGYRRADHDDADEALRQVFEDGVEGSTVYCSICDRRYAEEGDDVYMARRKVKPHQALKNIAKWQAAEVLQRALHHGEIDGYECLSEAEELTGEMPTASAQDTETEVRRAIRLLAEGLHDESHHEEVEHLCDHLYWRWGGDGWAGPGNDCD